jgi:amino acid adenylation domain-containing protein
MAEEVSPSMRPVDFDPFAESATATPLALTEPQREIYGAVQMGAEASCAFNQCLVLRLRGPLSSESMQRALALVVNRHDALRLCIASDEEVQAVSESVPIALPLVDLASLGNVDRDAAIARLIEHETHTPFDLTAAPLWRAQLVREQDDLHRLIFTAHHLVCDGWSSAVIFSDLASAYSADRFGMPAKLVPAASYREFVESAGSDANVAESKAAVDFWMQQYSDGVPSFELPLDYPRPPLKTYAAARELLRIDESLYAAVKKLGAKQGCTIFVTLLAAFEAVVARLSGSKEFVLGIPMASQALQENGHLVAHGVNTIPLRCGANMQHSFSEHLQAARRTFLDAQSHQRLTFGSLVQRLKLPRDPSRTPLVNVLFNIDKLGAPFAFGELVLEEIEAPKAFVNFELSINAIDSGHDLLIECDYNADLFSASTIAHWLLCYQKFLAAGADDPAVQLGALPLVTDEERTALLAGTQARHAIEGPVTLHEQIALQVARTPDAIALAVFGSDENRHQVTYAELDSRANRLARLLRARGIGRGALVGLCLERSQEMLVAQLAILKAGAAYVPLDPAYPAERLAYMAQDARLALLVTGSTQLHALAWPAESSLLLDSHAESIADHSDAPLAADLTLDAQQEDPAYVIYTSGSTGRPKGVVVPHRAVVNFLSSMARTPGLTETDRLVAVTTLSFDIAVLELFLPLTVGAQVVLASRDQAVDANALRDLMRISGATVMQATPSTWRMLVDAGWQGQPAFRALIGGESLPKDLAQDLLKRTGELWNMYGPTETTVWSTCWKVESPERGISIGRPIDNTQIRILDDRLQLSPIGVPGEICIGGDGVALGYLHRPDLTGERFIDDPFNPGGKLYRTGDRGRWRHDGLLEHQGRTDFQVKVRGHRIELGEIEANLADHPRVARVVVVAREDIPGDIRLAAYLVPKQAMPSASELREHLRAKLPDYMVPQHFIELDAIPLLPNGKTDRKALPPPSEADAARSSSLLEAPQTEAEIAIAEIWKQQLVVNEISVTDNFFDLGGHSLLAMRTINEMEKRLGIRVTVPRLVMETLAQIANGAALAAASTSQIPPKRNNSWLKRLSDIVGGTG